MDIPKLEENKCSVLIVEYATGIVYKKDLTLFRAGENEKEVFQFFDNFSDAKDFVLNLIKSKTEFECSIFDSDGNHMTTYNIESEKST